MTLTSPATMAGLIRFIFARIDDDEHEVRRLRRDSLRNPADRNTAPVVRDADRRLADCEARRNVLKYSQRLLVLRDLPAEEPVRHAAVQILRALATPYSDHPAYQQEWGS